MPTRPTEARGSHPIPWSKMISKMHRCAPAPRSGRSVVRDRSD